MTAGRYGQLGFKTETTYGTPVTVDQFHEGYLSGNPVRTQPGLVSNGINGRRTPKCIKPGAKTVQGTFRFELLPAPLATLLAHCFGTVATTGAGPYVHTFNLGSTDALVGLTTQVGIPDDTGTVRAFTYQGQRVTDFAIRCRSGAIAEFDLGTVAQDYVAGGSLAAASFGTDCPFTFIDGSVSIDGSPIGTIEDVTLTGTIPRRIQHALGSALIMEPVESGVNTYTIEATPKFEDLTLHDLANTEVTSVLTFDNGTDSLAITMNTFVEPSTPEVSGADSEASERFTGIVMSSTSDAAAITAVLTNSEASAA